MSFLRCNPTVFVIEDQYEILVNTEENGVIAVRVGDTLYYEANSGVLSSEKNYAKIRLPQKVLNAQKQYEVVYRKSEDRRAYFSVLGDEETQTFSFKPLEKTENIHLYHIADVHYHFSRALSLPDFFGEDLDVLVLNGDIGEVETINNYLAVIKFVGDLSKGEIPVIFVRGNHDTRGKLAELFTDFFPANGKDTYFWFELGVLGGVVLDCGEDKMDFHKEYGGVNDFSSFRARQGKWLEGLKNFSEEKIVFAVSHICPVQTTENVGCIFDIERECYTQWNHELERLGIRFMLNGHIHRAYILPPNDEKSTLPHNYPVVVGSELQDGAMIGAAITLGKEKIEVKFTKNSGEVISSYEL